MRSHHHLFHHLLAAALFATLGNGLLAAELPPDEPEFARHTYSQQVTQSMDHVLGPLARGAFGAHVGIKSGLDSNVDSLPGQTPTRRLGNPTGQSSVTGLVDAGFAYASSPLREIQVVTTYESQLAWNFNPRLNNHQYFTHDLAFYFARRPLEAFTYGLKIEGMVNFQVAGAQQRGGIELQSVIGSFGPYYRQRLSRAASFGLEFFLQPQNFYTDNRLPTRDRQTGFEPLGRAFWSYDDGEGLLNPTLALTGRADLFSGSRFANRSLELSGNNAIYLDEDLVFLAEGSFALLFFTEESPRTDALASLKATLSYHWGRVDLEAGVAYRVNDSRIQSESYRKAVALAGVNVPF
jgi:hypothetical protein